MTAGAWSRTRLALFAWMCVLLLGVTMACPRQASALGDEDFANKVSECFEHCEDNPLSGVALMGSSSFARWTDAPEMFESVTAGQPWKINADLVYNFGIAGSTSRQWLTAGYLDAIAEKCPGAIAIYGTNSLGAHPLNTRVSAKMVDRSKKQLIEAIQTIRRACLANLGYSPTFILISGVKTPNAFKRSKHISLRNALDADGDEYCVSWDRTDRYNQALREIANDNPDIKYCDIERYYYTVENGSLRYFINSRRASGRTVSAASIVSGREADTNFGGDLLHPTKEAYEHIWSHVINVAAKARLRRCLLSDIPLEGIPADFSEYVLE